MANELRVRANFVGGLIEDNPLASGATTLTSAGLVSLPAIGSTQHMAIILDPDGRAGNPEIAYVTAHTASATTATITKAQEGTAGRAHDRDTPWLHGPTIKDFDASGGGVGLIGVTAYHPASMTSVNTASSTLVDIDATNLVVVFTVPPSGKVLVCLSARAEVSNAGLDWGLREGSSVVTNSRAIVNYDNGADGPRGHYRVLFTGLTRGDVKTWKWAHANIASGTPGTRYGGTGAGDPGQALMEVWAVNL